MRLVEVVFARDVPDDVLRQVAELLPDLVAEAVDCPEQPWNGPPDVGDIEIRFRPRSDFDVGGLCLVLEVRSKLLGSRLEDKQRRADRIRDGLANVTVGPIGVWLVLHEGAWSQT